VWGVLVEKQRAGEHCRGTHLAQSRARGGCYVPSLQSGPDDNFRHRTRHRRGDAVVLAQGPCLRILFCMSYMESSRLSDRILILSAAPVNSSMSTPSDVVLS
jgi:hypothetical protein